MKNLILVLGGPGSGKGTLVSELSKKTDFKYIEVGKLLRSFPKDSDIYKTISKGDFVPNSVLFEIFKDILDDTKDILIDGFPRTIEQARWVIQKYKGKFLIKTIFLNLSKELMTLRINERLEKGSDRADDKDINIIMHRLENYENLTLPAIEYLKNNIEYFIEQDVEDGVLNHISEIFKKLEL